MRFRMYVLGAAALAATVASGTIGTGAAHAEGDGTAKARALTLPSDAQLRGEPEFVSEEIVQPLPEPTETDSEVVAVAGADTLGELLGTLDAPGDLSREMECLAGAVYFEARGEPIDGQLAVAQVVVNRTESRLFPSDYCGVVFQRAQFSFVKGGRLPAIRRGSGAWARARKIARIAHEGLWNSKADDSLYFHAKYVSPRWSRSKVARATINRHVFYR